jgi:hypothetical protein
MGCAQAEQPLLGKEGVRPAETIRAPTGAAKPKVSAQDASQPSASPAIEWFERPAMGIKRAIAPEARNRFKERVRGLTRRTRGVGVAEVGEHLSRYRNGWGGYFGSCRPPSALKGRDGRIRRRLRALLWQRWRTWRNRTRMLVPLGVPRGRAAEAAASSRGPRAMATQPTLQAAMDIELFDHLGLPQLRSMMGT